MIRYYRLEHGRAVQAPEGEGNIQVVVEPTAEERAKLVGQYQIDEHNLTSAMDMEELPRVELDQDHLVVIFKHPKRYVATDNLLFRIDSLGLFLFRDKLIMVVPSDMELFEGRLFTRVQNLQMLMLRTLSSCVTHFMSHLQVIQSLSNELEAQIETAMGNRSLLQMFAIEKSLVYYVNAVSANGRVIEKLKANARNTQSEGLSPEMLEYVDDVAIENAQCLEQSQVYANVFTGMMDARASIVNNNLNVLMKRLTVMNLVFMPLNIIAGIGGMSEFTMMTRGIPWQMAYSLFTVFMMLVGAVTWLALRFFETRSAGR